MPRAVHCPANIPSTLNRLIPMITTSNDRQQNYRPFGRVNGLLLTIALGIILLGYVLLRRPPADGPLSLTVAPLLLVLGYCVLVPLAILAAKH